MKGLEIKGHKIKILKDSQGIPLKIFLDDKEVVGADKIEIKYSYDCYNREKVQKISLRLIDFESLEVISHNTGYNKFLNCKKNDDYSKHLNKCWME